MEKRKPWAGQTEYDRAKVQTISFKTTNLKSRSQLKLAAIATGKSVNGFIRDSLNEAVFKAIGELMEKEEADGDDKT